jgi:hypothetical protein
LYFLIGKTPEQGAQTIIKAAISTSLIGIIKRVNNFFKFIYVCFFFVCFFFLVIGHGGAYLENCKEVPLSKPARDPVVAGKLWEVSSKMVLLPLPYLLSSLLSPTFGWASLRKRSSAFASALTWVPLKIALRVPLPIFGMCWEYLSDLARSTEKGIFSSLCIDRSKFASFAIRSRPSLCGGTLGK